MIYLARQVAAGSRTERHRRRPERLPELVWMALVTVGLTVCTGRMARPPKVGAGGAIDWD